MLRYTNNMDRDYPLGLGGESWCPNVCVCTKAVCHDLLLNGMSKLVSMCSGIRCIVHQTDYVVGQRSGVTCQGNQNNIFSIILMCEHPRIINISYTDNRQWEMF